MVRLRRLIGGLRALFSPAHAERELHDELNSFLELAAERGMAQGLSRDEAIRKARLEMGGLEPVKERVRDASWESGIEGLWLDARYTVRTLLRAPGFSAITVLTLALGLGASTAIFTVVYGVLLKPLPFAEPDRLVSVWSAAGLLNGGRNLPMSAALYFTSRDGHRTFEDIALWDETRYSVTGVGDPEDVEVMAVTDGMLPLLRTEPVAGRRFTAQDDSPGSADTTMLSYGYWQRRFNSDPAAVGKTIVVNGRPREIIGVLPRSFRFLNQDPALLLPFRFNRSRLTLGQFNYQGVARLRPGVTHAAAAADVKRLYSLYTTQWPLPPGGDPRMFQEDSRFSPIVRPLKDDAVGDAGKVLWVLLATIAIVLLIACANVANLLLVRTEGRHQELAVRSALGAGRLRIARSLLFESVLLSLAGGIAGIAVASGALQGLAAVAPATLPRRSEIGIDGIVLLFALAISIVSGVLFGLMPMLKYARGRLDSGLVSSGRTVSHGRERQRARDTLVVVQVALALVLVIASGLMMRTFDAMRRVDPGFARPGEVRTFRVAVPPSQASTPDAVVRVHQQILDRLQEIGSVSAAAFGSTVPMDGNFSGDPIFVEDRPLADGATVAVRQYKFSSPGYFSAIGTPVLAGRDFTWTDVYDKRHVAIISENVAREIWHEPAAALGRRIQDSLHGPWREIIGVVGDIRDDGVHRKPSPAVYWPVLVDHFWGQDLFTNRSAAFAIRTTRTDKDELLGAIQKAVWSVNPSLSLANITTLEQIYDRSMAQTSFALVMLAIAGLMALALGIVGVYSVISYAVAQRRREIGIRVALGAQRGTVRLMFLRHGFVLALIGVAGGLIAASALTRVMASLLFEVTPVDPATFAGASGGLVVAVLLATYLPARRATSVEPMIALRE